MRSNKHNTSSEILIRTFASTCTNEELEIMVAGAIETLPALNTCFMVESAAGFIRIYGLELRGEILLRTRSKGRTRKVDIFFRRGDRAIFNVLTESLSSYLKPVDSDETPRPSMLADYILRDNHIRGFGKLIFTDEAIDAAMLCTFSESEKLIEFSVNLRSLSNSLSEGVLGESGADFPESTPAKHDHVALYRGRKVRLSHRVTLLGRHSDLNLTVHFTWLPKESAFLVGWFSESINV